MRWLGLLLLNSKKYALIALMFYQFAAPDGSESEAGIWGISSIFTAKNLFAFTVWTLSGETHARRFQHPDQAKLMTV